MFDGWRDRPGVTLAQKAGSRQQALAVVRVETPDTPENRTIRDLLIRAIVACSKYIAENRRYPPNAAGGRVGRIRSFRRELRDYLENSPLAGVSPLVGAARPNYVIQRDQRYRPLWDVYLQLVRQQKQEDDAWRWRNRVWAEHLEIVLLSLLRHMLNNFPDAADTLLRSEQMHGRFIDVLSAPQGMLLKQRDSANVVDFVASGQLDAHPLIPEHVKRLCPDHVLLRRDIYSFKAVSMLAIWSVLDFGIEGQRLSDCANAVANRLSSYGCDLPIFGVFVHPSIDSSINRRVLVHLGNVTCAGVEVPPSLQGVSSCIEPILGRFLGKGMHHA